MRIHICQGNGDNIIAVHRMHIPENYISYGNHSVNPYPAGISISIAISMTKNTNYAVTKGSGTANTTSLSHAHALTDGVSGQHFTGHTSKEGTQAEMNSRGAKSN